MQRDPKNKKNVAIQMDHRTELKPVFDTYLVNISPCGTLDQEKFNN